MALNRTWLNSLVDDSGDNVSGSPWNKAAVTTFHDVIDAALLTVVPGPHASTHMSGSSDPIRLDQLAAPTDIATLNASVTAHGLLSKLSGITTSFLRGDGVWAAPTAAAHAATHKAGGSDAIALDTLAAPTDIATLNASVTAHGLLPKLAGGTTLFLRADGSWAVPPGGGGGGAHAATHAAGGGDTVDVKTLGGYPGGTTLFLRADGTFVAPPGGGGSGAVTIITNTQAGTLNDWAPAGMSGNTYIEWSGAANTVVTGIAGGTPGQTVTVRNSGSKVLTFADYASAAGAGSVATNRTNNTAKSAATPVATGGFATYVYVGAWWQLLTHEQGSWITPVYNAADFTAGSSMTWTVEAGDVRTYRYRLSGKTLQVEAVLVTTTTGGTASGVLNVKLPGGFLANIAEFTGSVFCKDTGGPWLTGSVWIAPASPSLITIWKDFSGTVWALSTNGVYVYATLTTEVG